MVIEPRLHVKALHRNVIEALVITGCARGNIVIIPRITLLCYDYYNKSKVQSLIMAGIGLREECFSHGQFYVAYFRVSSASSLVIIAQNGNTKKKKKNTKAKIKRIKKPHSLIGHNVNTDNHPIFKTVIILTIAKIIYYTDTPMTPLIDCLENSHLQIELSFLVLPQTSEKLINKHYGRCASMKFVSLSPNKRQLPPHKHSFCSDTKLMFSKNHRSIPCLIK
ncbi:ATP-dependent DNA helicase PIF1-like [Aphis craccivora]|uniref:ATP-dependent DNA helicase PIF1-like n=1 Tax=Aphis craccivora TaxID=307492 RepID=A0A6G0ZDT2_APHCR|nr:ATP-dependent DNA helicase PIF1-like [Aphis craccivora]